MWLFTIAHNRGRSPGTRTRSLHTNQDVYERLSPPDLKQSAVVEAIFLYNTTMRDQMLPRQPLPNPVRK